MSCSLPAEGDILASPSVNSDLFLCLRDFIYLFLLIHIWSGQLISNTLNILRSVTHC